MVYQFHVGSIADQQITRLIMTVMRRFMEWCPAINISDVDVLKCSLSKQNLTDVVEASPRSCMEGGPPMGILAMKIHIFLNE